MGKDKFEQYLQELLQDHKVSIDTNEIWPGIEETLPPTGNAAAWPYWALGAVLIGVVTWMLVPNASDTDGRVNDSSSKNLVLNQAEVEQNSLDQNTEIDQIASIQNNTNGDEASELLSEGVSTSALITPVTSASQRAEKISSDNKQNFTTNQAAVVNDGSKPSHIKTSATKHTLNQHLNRENVFDASSFVKKSIDDAALNASIATSIYEAEQGTPSPDNITSAHAMTTRQMEHSILSPLPAGLSDEYTVDKLSNRTIALPTLNDCYDFKGRSWALALDAYAGINYASKSLKSKSNELGAASYINSRENSEDFLEAFDAGLTVNFLNRRGYLASVGINYSQIDEKFNYFSVTTESRFDSVVTRIEIDSTGMIDSIREWRQVTVQTAREVLTYNYYRMVDIPIAVGYQFYKDKWAFEAQGGVMLNLLFKKQGELLNSALSVTEFTDNDLVFREKVGLSVFGSFKAIYPLNNRLGVYAEPYARFNLKSITVDNYALDQRYNNFGLRVGARFTF